MTNLGGATLGVAIGNKVWIDEDAAGYGWSGHGVELLSVVTHEFGHVLGLEHEDPYDVMAPTLGPGQRVATSREYSTVSYGVPYGLGNRADTRRTAHFGTRNPWSAGQLETEMTEEQHSSEFRARERFFETFETKGGAAVRVEPSAKIDDDNRNEVDIIGELAQLIAGALSEGDSSEELQEALEDEQFFEELVCKL
jgi:hypothetical protein